MTSNPERDLHTYLAADVAPTGIRTDEFGRLHNQRVSAPAGLPLHEPADRDADNVPSDRAEIARLHGRLADSERTITDLSARLKRREATIARVEALADELDRQPLGDLLADQIRDALRGPEPTDAP